MATIKLPKIFLDSGDPDETRRAKGILGHIDGQTTNPTLISKHPEVQKMQQGGIKMSEEALMKFYKEVVAQIEREIAGPISVEVAADWDTQAQEMLKQAHEMVTWGRNIYIKFPTTQEGVKAASEFVRSGHHVNMTLVFTQTQAAAAYAATLAGTIIPHFVSPFMGRYDDRGYLGLDLLKNIIKMYKNFGKQRNTSVRHVQVLASSIRTLDHFYGATFLGADALTVPLRVLTQWVHDEKWVPEGTYRPTGHGLKSLKYEDIPFKSNFEEYEVQKVEGDLLDEGLKRFATDWKRLLA